MARQPSWLDTLLDWLARRRGATLSLTAVYFVAIVMSHEWFQSVALWSYERFGRERVNVAVQVIGAVLLILVARLCVRAIRDSSHRVARVALCLGTGLLAGLSYPLLFYTDMEAVHFPQYAILVFPIYALVGRYALTILLVTLLGLLDESFQYFITHAGWCIQLDFNDVVLNLIGGAMGCLLIFLATGGKWTKSPAHRSRQVRLIRSPVLLIYAALAVGCAVLYQASVLTVYPRAGGTKPALVLRRQGPPTAFWQMTPWRKRYHELLPHEGVLLVVVLIGMYGAMDWLSSQERESNRAAGEALTE